MHVYSERTWAVGTATGYRLDDRGGSGFETKYNKEFPFLLSFQIGSGSYPTSYSIAARGYFLMTKLLRCEADHSPPNGNVKNFALHKRNFDF
jgi:hypothetical protein